MLVQLASSQPGLMKGTVALLENSVTSLSEYSKQKVLQWIPGHCGVTGKEFADNQAKKGAFIQQITRKAVPFTSARRIIQKKLNDLSSRRYAEINSNNIWWNNLRIFPCGQDVKQLLSFV
ncbi:hypothetical protein TNCV_355541 [Trichonephila clavipes]|uniref:RNase H type-1 domain-containing protein n=1 Tax=Trichonephila clavipes TaxID=2585209 RepID=A0A8X7BC37_TRICX|nr:hypothetical protein TNCV_355541 [Trichonephila clavipes]